MKTEKNPFNDPGKGEHPATNSNPCEPLTKEELERIKCLFSKGIGVNEVAREMKRSASTVSRALKKMKISKAVGVARAGRLLDQKLNASQDLRKIHDRAIQILDKLRTETSETAEKYALLVLKACDAVRRDLELHLRIWEALYNVEEVAKWQNELMDILGEIDPDARERFYTRLQEKRPV
jgi:IS30 family transposase